MKKLLLLGAMQMHLPLIQRAKERGIYVITCDYIPENIGHKYADEAHFDSTTDCDAVMDLAKKSGIDGIMTFNSDPAALTAAFVADKLHLPGSGYAAVEIMSEKDKFRSFLKDNGFNVPKFGQYTDLDSLLKDIEAFQFPIMLKPVDSSGSKGVVKIDRKEEIQKSFENALQFSRCKRIIVEDFISIEGPQMHGDAFVYDGKIKFFCLGDHHFDSSINNLVPISTTFPSIHSESTLKQVENEVQRFISAVGFKQGGINIEARVYNGKIYLIEVGPRNGGNFTPIVIQNSTGFNFIDAALDTFLGLGYNEQHCYANNPIPCAYLVIHSDTEGILQSVDVNKNLESKIIAQHNYLNPGDRVKSFRGANAAIGVILARFKNCEEMTHYVENMKDYIKAEIC